MQKTIFLLVLISVLAVTGCAEEKQTPQNIVENPTGTSESKQMDTNDDVQQVPQNIVESPEVSSESEQIDANDGVKQVQVTGPVTFRSDAFWQWHEQTIGILESKVGTDVRIYCYDATHIGKLKEVNEYYAVLEVVENSSPSSYSEEKYEICVSIDAICSFEDNTKKI